MLSPDLEVIRLIGGTGSSSKIELLSFEWNRNDFAVGGGIIAHSDNDGSIQVFSTDGTLITTFDTEHQALDMTVSKEGSIITLTRNPIHPVISYDREGSVLRRLGPAFIKDFDGTSREGQYLHGMDHFRLTALSDGVVVLFSRTWLRFRLFDRYGEYRDHPIEPMRLFRPGDDREEIEHLREKADQIEEWRPERVNDLVRAGEWQPMQIGSVTGGYIGIGVTSGDGSIWLYGTRRLIECDSRGRIRRLLDNDLDGYWGPAIRDGRIVLFNSFNGSLAVGRIPNR